MFHLFLLFFSQLHFSPKIACILGDNILFLYWCIECPEQLAAWAKKRGFEDEISMSASGLTALQKNVLDTYTEACGDAAAGNNTDKDIL